MVARIYDPKRAEVYERLGIPTVATVPWTASRLLKRCSASPRPRRGATRPVWWRCSGSRRTRAGSAARLVDFEAATGARTALVTRFGKGQLPTPSTLIQSGDTLHVLVTDEHCGRRCTSCASSGPDGGNR